MIRPVIAREEDGHATFGLTYFGLAVIAFEIAVTFAAVVLSGIALAHANDTGTRNCRNIASLTRIERTFVEEQQAQTKALLRNGVTFGIPKDQLPKLLAASEASQERFLRAFDALTLVNC